MSKKPNQNRVKKDTLLKQWTSRFYFFGTMKSLITFRLDIFRGLARSNKLGGSGKSKSRERANLNLGRKAHKFVVILQINMKKMHHLQNS